MYEKPPKMRADFVFEPEAFGRNLRLLRRHLGWNDKKLAAELGCSDGAVRNWESGKAAPSEEHVQAILRLAPEEVKAEWLVAGTGDTPIWTLSKTMQSHNRRAKQYMHDLQNTGGRGLSVSYSGGRLIIDVPADQYRLDVVEGGVKVVRI
jgi:transcriptional regulator with XRE-family HTH domain